jgi:hypothetical protein
MSVGEASARLAAGAADANAGSKAPRMNDRISKVDNESEELSYEALGKQALRTV